MRQKTNNLKLVTIILTVIFSLVTGLLSRRIKVLDPHAQPNKKDQTFTLVFFIWLYHF